MAVYNVQSLSFTKDGNTYNFDAGSAHFVSCNTAGATQIKEVTISGITTLEEGLSIRIAFANAQLYDGVPKIQINSLTAADIQSSVGVNGAMNMWKAGDIIDFVYTGNKWVAVDLATEKNDHVGLSVVNGKVCITYVKEVDG